MTPVRCGRGVHSMRTPSRRLWPAFAVAIVVHVAAIAFGALVLEPVAFAAAVAGLLALTVTVARALAKIEARQRAVDCEPAVRRTRSRSAAGRARRRVSRARSCQ